MRVRRQGFLVPVTGLFFQLEIFRSKNCRPMTCLPMFCLSCLKCFFSLYAVAFNFLIYFSC